MHVLRVHVETYINLMIKQYHNLQTYIGGNLKVIPSISFS